MEPPVTSVPLDKELPAPLLTKPMAKRGGSSPLSRASPKQLPAAWARLSAANLRFLRVRGAEKICWSRRTHQKRLRSATITLPKQSNKGSFSASSRVPYHPLEVETPGPSLQTLPHQAPPARARTQRSPTGTSAQALPAAREQTSYKPVLAFTKQGY